jgi:hypothetical protein
MSFSVRKKYFMPTDDNILRAIESYLTSCQIEITSRAEEKLCTRIDVKTGIHKCNLNIYHSGKIVVGGKDSQLKQALLSMKTEVEAGNFNPSKPLPLDLERLPEILREKIPACDPVIYEFVCEAKKALKADLLLSSAFLVGAASEKAIYLLVDAYTDAIKEAANREKFIHRTSKSKVISARFEEFMTSYKSCKTKPSDPILLNDSFTILNSLFTFYRLTRNSVGHPQVVPSLDKGILLANIGQIIHYLETVYGLIEFFKANPVEV